ncbi:glutamate 5-kinase [Streptomyces sp. NPDC001118]
MSTRTALPDRIVVKVGTSSLVSDGKVDPGKVSDLAGTVADLIADGTRPLLVTSGAIAVGRRRLGHLSTRSALSRRVCAAVGQAELFAAVSNALAERGLSAAQFLLTPLDLIQAPHRESTRTALERALDYGLVPVLNENDAIMVRNNDVLAAMISAMMGARVLVLMTDVQGLYDGDPNINPAAIRIPVVEVMHPGMEQLAGSSGAGPGTGGMAAKLSASWIATLAGVATVIVGADEPGALSKALGGADVGTWVKPAVLSEVPDLGLLWRTFSSAPRGRLVLVGSAQAVIAARQEVSSHQLTAVQGDFGPGDVVDVIDSESRVMARGPVRCDAHVLRRALEDRGEAVERALERNHYITFPEV